MSRIIGLTGQSGAGKTVVSELFDKHGFAVINCDLVAREVTKPRSECCLELLETFPGCVDEETLTLNRRALGEIVFSDRKKLDMLNEIIFKYIRTTIDQRIAELSSDHEYILMDAPTLFEARVDELCDIVVSVTADEETRLKRVVKRDGIDRELALKRFGSQLSEEFFETHSDYVIRNDGDLENAIRQTENVINRIKEG